MIPVKLKLSNFTSYGEKPPELDFTSFRMAAISGSNGAGKSSLLDAITWCLWGQSRAGDAADDLVRLGSTEMTVEFNFLLDDHRYTIKRRRSKKGGGSTALEFWSNSHNLTEGTIKATQQKIIDALHLTFETFTNSSFLRQGHADEFTTKGPTDRKRILADILGLDHYDRLEEKARERVKDLQSKLQLIEYQLPELEVELSQGKQNQSKRIETEQKIARTENQIKILEKEIKDLRDEKAKLNALVEQQEKIKLTLKEFKDELDAITNDGKKRADAIKELKAQLSDLPSIEERLQQLKDLQKQLEIFNQTKQKILALEKNLSDTKGSLNLKTQKKGYSQKKLLDIEEEIKNLEKEDAKCPVCGQEINKDQKHQVKQSKLKELDKIKTELKEINTKQEESEILNLNKEIEKLQFEDDKYRQIQTQIVELEQLSQKKDSLIKKQATLESEEKVLGDLRKLFANKKTQVEKLQLEVGGLPSLSQNLDTIDLKLYSKDTKLNSLRSEEKEARNILGQVVGLISRFDQLVKVKKELEDKRGKFNLEKETYEELALAFGKKGIQAMIIEQVIPEIEDEANRLLDKLTEGRMKVALETQKETKTKIQTAEGKIHATVETLDIIISDEMGERSYELYSGGESFRVNFALRLAISKLLAHRAGAKLQFLIIDEGFGTQDAAGRARLVEVLDAIKEDFEKILVITHIEELKEEFPTRVEVSKTAGGSTFEIIGN